MPTTNLQHQLNRRNLLIIIVILALCTWGGLALFTYYIQPSSLPAILAVFVLLGIALCCTCTVLIYLISWSILVRRARHPGVLQALRESGLITVWLLFNLLLSALHSWSVFTTVVSFGIIIVIELLALKLD